MSFLLKRQLSGGYDTKALEDMRRAIVHSPFPQSWFAILKSPGPEISGASLCPVRIQPSTTMHEIMHCASIVREPDPLQWATRERTTTIMRLASGRTQTFPNPCAVGSRP